MKLFLLAAMLVSGSAFARGSDNDWVCRVTAYKPNGQFVRYTTRPTEGGLGRAHLIAIRNCKAHGLRQCRANCFSVN